MSLNIQRVGLNESCKYAEANIKASVFFLCDEGFPWSALFHSCLTNLSLIGDVYRILSVLITGSYSCIINL